MLSSVAVATVVPPRILTSIGWSELTSIGWSAFADATSAAANSEMDGVPRGIVVRERSEMGQIIRRTAARAETGGSAWAAS